MKQNKKPPEAGPSWMDTYGDMVTLLLCFFVLLYSISSVDQVKWASLVKSFNPEADVVSQVVLDELAQEDGTFEVPGGSTADEITEMFEQLQEALQSSEALGEASIESGEGFTFITFPDSVFFDGNSSVLKPEGQLILDEFSKSIEPADEAIREIRVLGHTSQGSPDVPNNYTTDRVLAATRSAVVVAYIQEKEVIESGKFISEGYGQFRPIASFETAEDRAKNRRVEILITETGSAEQSLDEYYKSVYGETEQ